MVLECKNCSAQVQMVVLVVHEEDGQAQPGVWEPAGRWTFGHCPICHLPLLGLQLDYGDGFEDDSPTRMFPARDRILNFRIPQSIKSAFDEAVTCFKVKAFTATVIMCRKSLEGLCVEHEVKTGTLSQKLKKLRDKEIIEKRLFEWAEELRTLGNEAAHGVGTSISRDDAKDTLDFTEALIQYVFTYQDQFAAFKKRRQTNNLSARGEHFGG